MPALSRNTSPYVLALCAALSIAAPALHAADLWANGGVPMRDQRHSRKMVVRTVTAHISNDALAVAVYGKDQHLLDDLERAVRAAHAKGWPVVGIVVGSTTDPRGVDIYADGLLIAEQPAPGAHIYEQTMKSLAYGADLLKHELRNASSH